MQDLQLIYDYFLPYLETPVNCFGFLRFNCKEVLFLPTQRLMHEFYAVSIFNFVFCKTNNVTSLKQQFILQHIRLVLFFCNAKRTPTQTPEVTKPLKDFVVRKSVDSKSFFTETSLHFHHKRCVLCSYLQYVSFLL